MAGRIAGAVHAAPVRAKAPNRRQPSATHKPRGQSERVSQVLRSRHAVGESTPRQEGASAREATSLSNTPGQAVQRACSACEELQPKTVIGPANDRFEVEADRVAERVMRMPAPSAAQVTPTETGRVQGSTQSAAPIIRGLEVSSVQRRCAKCSGELQRSVQGERVMRVCSQCECDVQRPPAKDEEESLVQAKRADSSRATGDIDRKLSHVRTGGSPLPSRLRAFYEPRFGRDFSAVRVHTDPAAGRAADAVGARAFALGNHVAFAAGQYNPHSASGRRLLAHELTHTAQQGHAPLLSAGGGQRLGHGAAGVQRGIVDDIVDAGEAVVDTAVDTATTVGEAVVDTATAVGEAVVDTAEFVGDQIAGIATWIWDRAREIAQALGGDVYLDGTRLVIVAPSIPACPEVDVDLTLPTARVFIPVIQPGVPIAKNLMFFGALGVNIDFTPTVMLRLGPCLLHGVRLVIDPLRLSMSATGTLDINGGLGVRAQADAGLRIQGTAMMVYPQPATVLVIPELAAEAGFTGSAQATGQIHSSTTLAGSFGLGGASFSISSLQAVGLTADLAAAGYGSVELSGVEMCRFHYPLWSWHGDAAYVLTLGAGVGIGSSGASVTLNAGAAASVTGIPYHMLPQVFDHSLIEDDCSFCTTFYQLGIMPSQNGASWNPAAPEHQPWPLGPLTNIHQRQPGIPSGSSCRGACGSNCDTCTPNEGAGEDRVECEPLPNGRHRFWIYPEYVLCSTHQACRDHDSCYDWCDAGSFVEGTMGPCHRMCDLECLCAHDAPACIGWIGGTGGDNQMEFSGPPRALGECQGDCPNLESAPPGPAQGGGGGGAALPATIRVHLGDVPLFGSIPVAIPDSPVAKETDKIVLYDEWILTKIGIFNLEAFAAGRISGQLLGTVGPAYLHDLYLDFDPLSGKYSGHAALHAEAGLEAVLKVTGALGGSVDYMWVFNIACAAGFLQATGTAALTGALDQSLLVDGTPRSDVPVGCEGGGISVANTLQLSAALELGYTLEAWLRVRPLGGLFGEYRSPTYQIDSAQYRRGFDSKYELPPFAAGVIPALAIAGEVLDLTGLLRQLLDWTGLPIDGDLAGGGELNPCGGGGGGGGDDNDEPPPPDDAPTGELNDPIPMTWFTPKFLYPQSLTLATRTAGTPCTSDANCSSPTPTCTPLLIGPRWRSRCVDVDSYPLDQRRNLPALDGRRTDVTIGVEHYPSPNSDPLAMDPRRRAERTNGAAQRNFRSRIQGHGHNMSREQADHVLDSQWSGADDFSNLWPLNSRDNTNGGNRSVRQVVTFSDSAGSVHSESIGTIRGRARTDGFGAPGVPVGPWFKIVRETRP